MNHEKWLSNLTSVLGTTHMFLMEVVASVQPEDTECYEHWVFDKVCGIKSQLENILASLDEDN